MPKRPATAFDELADSPQFPGHDWMKEHLLLHEKVNGALKPSSKRAYASVWRAFLVYLASHQRDAARADARIAGDFLSRHSQSTAQRYGRLLKEVYANAVQTGKAQSNPFAKLKGVIAGEEKRTPSPALKVPDVRFFIRSLPEPVDWEDQRDQAAAVLVLGAGLRLRELRELTTSQFNEAARQVQMRGRSVRSRVVDVEPAVATFIGDWLALRRQLKLEVSNDFMFPSRSGDSIPVNTFYVRIRGLLQQAFGEGLPHFGVGVLRAGFAQSFKQTDDVVAAQYALGHRRITSTIRYFRHLKPINPKTSVT